MKKKNILLLLALLLVCGVADAQKGHRKGGRTFDFALRGGVNASQIDGDGSGNYNKLGFHAGFNTSFPLGDNEAWRMLVEIGFTQKGSYVKQADRRISLYYVEVPLLLTYTMMEEKLRVGAGIAPAILASARVTENDVYDSDHSKNYKRLDPLPLCVSARYKISDLVAFDVRYYNSMLNIAIENGSGAYRIFRSNKGQFSRLVEAGLVFCF